jgi:hypothetical protein
VTARRGAVGLLDKRRERKARDEAEPQLAAATTLADQRDEAIDLLQWMVDDSQPQPGVDAPGFEERKGERTFAVLNGVSQATREWAWSKRISLDHDDALPWTSLPVSNRRRTSGQADR